MLYKVPTINDEIKDFHILFSMCEEIRSSSCDVTFDFSDCWFLKQNAITLLGGLARFIEYRGYRSVFDWDSIHNDIKVFLERNGFIGVFSNGRSLPHGNSVPYREDDHVMKDDMISYLKSMWLGRAWVSLSEPLVNRIAGRTWEIYENAFEHSGSDVGVFTCGQHYPRLKLLKLTVADFGCGIPNKVRQYCQGIQMDDGEALQWAFLVGNSTATLDDIHRGMGLGELKSFVNVSRGILEIYSNAGYMKIADGQETCREIETYFEGTVVNLTFQCDEIHYILESEQTSEDLF